MALERRKFTVAAGHSLGGGWYEVPVGDISMFQSVFIADCLGVSGPAELLDADAAMWGAQAIRLRLNDSDVGCALLVVGQWRD